MLSAIGLFVPQPETEVPREKEGAETSEGEASDKLPLSCFAEVESVGQRLLDEKNHHTDQSDRLVPPVALICMMVFLIQ